MKFIVFLLVLFLAIPCFASTAIVDGEIVVSDTVMVTDDDDNMYEKVHTVTYDPEDMNVNIANCNRIISNLNKDKPKDYKWNVSCVEKEILYWESLKELARKAGLYEENK